MANKNGNAYALTTFCPIRHDGGESESFATSIRNLLNHTDPDHHGPMAQVPNTYFCRFFVMDDVVYQGKPAIYENLKSNYLVFTVTFYGELDTYLHGMWQHAGPFVRDLWRFCVGFDQVHDEASFAHFIQRCQVDTTFYFNGSTQDPLAEQLKSLYVKQEFAEFAAEHQGLPAAELQHAFNAFVARIKPGNLAGPTWRAGATSLDEAVVGES